MATQATPPSSPRIAKSFLSAVKRGVQKRPLRAVAYGPEGVGKTLFASNAPSPIFLGCEDGFGTIDAARFPSPSSWTDVRAALHELATAEHEFKTLVIDTADWIEPLLQQDVCKRHGKNDIEAFGFGKGYVIALDEGWRPLLGQLEELGRKGMHVVILAHAKSENHQPPDGDAYERWTLKIDKRASGLLKEWCDTLLFMQWAGGFVDKSGDRKKGRAVGERVRTLYTQSSSGAFEAKNRFGLAPVLPLDWAEFFDGYERAFDKPRLLAEFEALSKSAPADLVAKARAWMADDANDLSRISRSIDRLRALATTNTNATTEE
jgi:hypothetical protein